jgi:hypothetical protein
VFVSYAASVVLASHPAGLEDGLDTKGDICTINTTKPMDASNVIIYVLLLLHCLQAIQEEIEDGLNK